MGAEQFQNEEALSDLVNRLLSLKVSVIALILSIFLPYPLENRSFPLLVCSSLWIAQTKLVLRLKLHSIVCLLPEAIDEPLFESCVAFQASIALYLSGPGTVMRLMCRSGCSLKITGSLMRFLVRSTLG